MRRSAAQAYRLPATHRDTKAAYAAHENACFAGFTNNLLQSHALSINNIKAKSSIGLMTFFVSFRVGRRPAFVTCGWRAPPGAAVVARLARHRLKPCRGDTAECCHKATRRSQGSWSRVIRPRRQASGCLSARCTCGEAVRSPDERSEELCEAKSQEGAREPRRGRKGPSANTVSQPPTRSTCSTRLNRLYSTLPSPNFNH